MSAPVLLTDTQIQQFICDGFIVLQPKMDESVHRVIDEKFCWLAENEKNPGNNILARLPELNKIIESPEVIGAMISLLGEDYIKIPHCFWHNRAAGNNKLFNVDNPNQKTFKENVGANSHQDSYCPTSMGKSHPLQYLRFMYYSHDMELKNGPTHVSPGTQYHSSVSDEDRQRETPVIGKAGTIFLSHFELIHAGSPNESDRVRNMIKFLFTRSQNMKVPSWENKSTVWVEPSSHSVPYQIENCWKQQWRWLCNTEPSSDDLNGKEPFNLEFFKNIHEPAKLIQAIQSIGKNSDAIDYLISLLDNNHQAVRTSSIYALGLIKKEAIKPLVSYLADTKFEGKNDLPQASGVTISFSDSAQALIACGEEALEEIGNLLNIENDWVCMNALHIIASIGSSTPKLNEKIIACLNSKSYLVVSFAATALGRVGNEETIPTMLNILNTGYDVENHKAQVDDLRNAQWPHQWIIHFNAALALVRLSKYANKYENELSAQLSNPFGQVTILLCECLNRIGTPSALRALVDFYKGRRWDDNLCATRCF
jgi:hypothetical protein